MNSLCVLILLLSPLVVHTFDTRGLQACGSDLVMLLMSHCQAKRGIWMKSSVSQKDERERARLFHRGIFMMQMKINTHLIISEI